MSDEKYLKIAYKITIGKELNLTNPTTFNEKLQWLKLYDRNPLYTKLVDKYEVKEYVKEKIGEAYIIPTLGVWDSFDEIDFDALPAQFVLKCTHDSGGLIICKDKSTFDKAAARRKINRCLRHNFYWGQREWPYKNVKPRIIAEAYMEDKQLHELRDYKFFCFDGKVRCFKIDFDRFVKHRANYYDPDGVLLPFGEKRYMFDPNVTLEMPGDLKKMIEIAENLAKGLRFVRVDLYYIDSRVYFGEITFYPASGMGRFEPAEWDSILGSWIKLQK
ncbi:MAG: ATP-grasp fold amidoligase family protein [Clostridia bacterium]